MKKILIILTLLFSLSASAQVDTTKQIQTISANGYAYKHLQAIYAMLFPTDTMGLKSDWRGIAFKDTLPYFWTGKAFRPFGTGSGSGAGITQLGNSGNLWLMRPDDSTYAVDTATANTFYRTLFPQLSGSYANPSWISSLAWSKITGTPTTLSGYGITDAVPSSRTITINGTTYDLSANRSWTVSGSGQASRFDSSYTPLGGNRGSEYIVKSVRIRRNSITVTPTQIGDSAMYWDISVPTTYIDSMRRVGLNVQAYKNGAWETVFTDSVGSGGGGGSPAGNYGNVQLNRNGAFATPGSDSLNFSAGLIIKGILSASALPTGGVDADSVVVINSSGAFKKRNVSAFARMNTTSAANQFALFNGNGTLYSSSKFNFSDATYPTMSIIGSDPLIYIGPSATLTNNPSFGSGAGAAIYGGATYKSVQLVDQISGGIQMARFYNSGGTIYNNLNGLIISNTTSSPSNYQGSYTIQRTIPYAVTGLNYHGFTDQTDFRVGTNAFNSFGSFVTIGNNRTSQDHYAGFQTVWYKDSTNRIGKIYDFVSAVSEMRAGTVDTLYRFKVFEATKTGGTIVKQYGIQIDNLSNATTNVGAWIYNNVGIGPTAHTPSERLTVDGNILGTGTIKTADPGSGAGAWKLGTAVTSSGLVLKTTQYVEISIDGTVYRLALVDPPTPQP